MKYRIEPIEGADVNPHSGGSWLRDPDGGLTPADAETAANAGLLWRSVAPPVVTLIEPLELE